MSKFIQYILILISIWMGILGIFIKNYNILVCAIALFFIHNIIYCLDKIVTRIFLLMFHVVIFVFLLSRPIIAIKRGENWWTNYNSEDIEFALLVIAISLVGLYFGALIQEKYKKKTSSLILQTSYQLKFQENLKKIAQMLFYFSSLFCIILELEKLHFMYGKTYVEYYVSFKSQMPYFIYVLSTFMQYALCIFLATFPQKKECILPLGIYWCLAIPELIIGIRNPIMLRSVFIFLYFFMREKLENNGKWIGKIEKGALIIMTPVVLCFMGIYSHIRAGEVVYTSNIFTMLENFFYGQGVSFNVLAIGHGAISKLPQRKFRNYTFGGIIDYFKYGKLGQVFLGTEPLESGNNVRNALESNSFAHNMSYVTKGEKYLQGQGWGSSYLLETYTDYGYVGVFVFSLILGVILIYGTKIWEKTSLQLIICLLVLTKIFFAPRGAATESIEFFTTIQFWISLLLCYLGAGLCCKNYEKQYQMEGNNHV